MFKLDPSVLVKCEIVEKCEILLFSHGPLAQSIR